MPVYIFNISAANEFARVNNDQSKNYFYGYSNSEAVLTDPSITERVSDSRTFTDITTTPDGGSVKYQILGSASGVRSLGLFVVTKGVKLPYQAYALDTGTQRLVRLEDFYAGQPASADFTTTASIADFAAIKSTIVSSLRESITGIGSTAAAARSFFGTNGIYDLAARKALLDLENGRKIDYGGSDFSTRITEIPEAGPFGATSTAIKAREGAALATIQTTLPQQFGTMVSNNTNVKSFLVAGKAGKYTDGTEEKVLYDDVMSIASMYGVKDKFDAIIDADPGQESVVASAQTAVTGATGAATAAATGAADAAATAAADAAAAAGVGDPKEPADPKAIREKIAKNLEDNLIARLKDKTKSSEEQWTGLQLSDFSENGDITKILVDAVKGIRDGSEYTYEKPKVEQLQTYEKEKVINGVVLNGGRLLGRDAGVGIRGEFPPAFKAFVDNEANKGVKDFLKLGVEDKLTGEGNITTYKSLLAFATFLGVEASFTSIAKGEAPAAPPSTPTTTTPAAEAPSGAAAPSSTTASSDAPLGEAEPVKNPTVLYVMIAAADPAGNVAETGKPAKITFKYSAVGDTDDEGAASFSISGDKLDKIIPIKLSAAPDMFKRAAESSDPIRITVEAVPVTGGDAIEKTLTTVIRIPKEGQRASSDPLVFRMGRTLGWSPYEGDKADEGRGGAANFKNQSGEVTQVFWTPGGGVGFSNTNVTVSAMGSTYIFEFPEAAPLIVPVRMQVKNPDALQEGKIMSEARTVPHWIFIRPDAAGDRGGAGGGRGGRGKKGADGAGEAINACVTRIKFETKAKWINLPTILNPKDIVPGSIDIDITRGSGSDLTKMPKNAKKVMCEKDLRAALGSGMSGLNEQLYRSLFVFSEAWDRLGVACWVQSSSVTGRSGVTARRQTQRLGMGY